MGDVDSEWILARAGKPIGDDITLNEALKVVREAPEQHLVPAPARYRRAEWTRERAELVAHQAMADHIAAAGADGEWTTLRYRGEDIYNHFFISRSLGQLKSGNLPYGHVVLVDKVDGHVWSEDESRKLWTQLGRLHGRSIVMQRLKELETQKRAHEQVVSKDEPWALTQDETFVSDDMALDALLDIKCQRLTEPLFPVPAKYRQPAIDSDLALEIAQRELTRRVDEATDAEEYGPPKLLGEDVMRFTFIRRNARLVELGMLPGGLACSVDKVDGHVWQESEGYWFSFLIEEEDLFLPGEIEELVALNKARNASNTQGQPSERSESTGGS